MITMTSLRIHNIGKIKTADEHIIKHKLIGRCTTKFGLS